MKITKQRLTRIIREEITKVLKEEEDWDGDTGMPLTRKAMKMCANNNQCADKWIHNPSPENKAAMLKHRQSAGQDAAALPHVKALAKQFDQSMKAAQERGDKKAFDTFNKHRAGLAALLKKKDYDAVKQLAKDWGVLDESSRAGESHDAGYEDGSRGVDPKYPGDMDYMSGWEMGEEDAQYDAELAKRG